MPPGICRAGHEPAPAPACSAPGWGLYMCLARANKSLAAAISRGRHLHGRGAACTARHKLGLSRSQGWPWVLTPQGPEAWGPRPAQGRRAAHGSAGFDRGIRWALSYKEGKRRALDAHIRALAVDVDRTSDPSSLSRQCVGSHICPIGQSEGSCVSFYFKMIPILQQGL